VVKDIAGVVGTVASVVGAATYVGEEVISADWICTSSMVVAVKPLKPVVQMIWPTVNMRPLATIAESEMMTIWFAWEAVRKPLPDAPLSTKAG